MTEDGVSIYKRRHGDCVTNNGVAFVEYAVRLMRLAEMHVFTEARDVCYGTSCRIVLAASLSFVYGDTGICCRVELRTRGHTNDGRHLSHLHAGGCALERSACRLRVMVSCRSTSPFIFRKSSSFCPTVSRFRCSPNALGYAFAMTSYRKTGLAVQEGIDDLHNLVTLFSSIHGAPTRTYLVGPSEGGLIATLAVERFPETFHGGIPRAVTSAISGGSWTTSAIFACCSTTFFRELLPGDAATRT